MADKLRKFRKDSYVEKRFGKDINISTKEDAPLKKDMSAAETKSVSKAQPSSGAAKQTFKEAFAAARKSPEAMKAGKFTWNGKSYSTALASEKKAASAPVRRAAPAPTSTAKASTAKASTTPAPAPKKVEAPNLKTAFERAGNKPTPITSTGKTPRLLDRSTKGTPAPTYAQQRATKLENMRRDAEAPGASNYAKDRYRMAKETNMYAKGGKIDGCAVRGKTKAGRKK